MDLGEVFGGGMIAFWCQRSRHLSLALLTDQHTLAIEITLVGTFLNYFDRCSASRYFFDVSISLWKLM